MDILQVFFYGFLIDLMFILWFYAAESENYPAVCVTAVLLAAPSVYGIITIVNDTSLAPWYLFGLGVGSMAGVFVKKRIRLHKEKKSEAISN